MKSPRSEYTLDQWLEWIESCHPAEIELGLARVEQVAKALELIHLGPKVVTVSGTNGKGSTVTYIDTILRTQGYSVGTFTSPHFHRYNERIQLAGKPVDDQLICHAFVAIDEARGDIELTYFEYGTLAALWVFKTAKVDVAVLEVGLGGRLDAVNVCEPDVSIVTSIGIDHVDWLGSDINVIGYEKAGIFRKDKPAVCGDPSPPYTIAEHAANIHAQFLSLGTDFLFEKTSQAATYHWAGYDAKGVSVSVSDIELGALPVENVPTAIQGVYSLGLPVSETSIRQGIKAASMIGRMQRIVLAKGEVILDVAHNPHAAIRLAKSLAASKLKYTLVAGMLSDKDAGEVLATLAPYIESYKLVTLDVPRGMTAAELYEYLPSKVMSSQVTCFEEIGAAIQEATAELKEDQPLLIVGSFFTVAPALQELEKLEDYAG